MVRQINLNKNCNVLANISVDSNINTTGIYYGLVNVIYIETSTNCTIEDVSIKYSSV